jgi:hypothetical protein
MTLYVNVNLSDSSVGASVLAKDVNDNECCLDKRSALTSFASKLAPTVTVHS